MNEKNNFLKIINLDVAASTNDYAFDLAQKGEKEMVVVKANHQTQGRGRRDSQWASPKDKGIYASFLLRPKNALNDLIWLPLFFSYAAVCCLDSIVNADIKWPNDIIVNDKKIGGVLIEAKSQGQKVDFAVCGIGLNVNSKKEQIPLKATSLYIETGKIHNIDELFEKLLANVIGIYKEFKKGNIEPLLDKASGSVGEKQKIKEIIQKYSKKDIEDLIILR